MSVSFDCCGTDEEPIENSLTSHWDKTYTREIQKLGWYEENPEPSLQLIEKCSGLYVFRYNKEMIQKKLGSDFELIEAFDHTYKMPSGDTREYIYILFQRKE